MADPTLPRAPAGLKTSGRKLWRGVVEAFGLRDDELVLLGAACRLADEITALEEMIGKSTAMIIGSKQQLRVNPLYGEARQHRLALGRLLAQLGLADAGEASVQARSAAGRRMAIARWAKGR